MIVMPCLLYHRIDCRNINLSAHLFPALVKTGSGRLKAVGAPVLEIVNSRLTCRFVDFHAERSDFPGIVHLLNGDVIRIVRVKFNIARTVIGTDFVSSGFCNLNCQLGHNSFAVFRLLPQRGVEQRLYGTDIDVPRLFV